MGCRWQGLDDSIDLKDYDGVEVAPIETYTDEGGNKTTQCQICDKEEDAEFWSVYGHLVKGHVNCFSDWDTKEEAMAEGARVRELIREAGTLEYEDILVAI